MHNIIEEYFSIGIAPVRSRRRSLIIYKIKEVTSYTTPEGVAETFLYPPPRCTID
jgi:hypothetical protein